MISLVAYFQSSSKLFLDHCHQQQLLPKNTIHLEMFHSIDNFEIFCQRLHVKKIEIKKSVGSKGNSCVFTEFSSIIGFPLTLFSFLSFVKKGRLLQLLPFQNHLRIFSGSKKVDLWYYKGILMLSSLVFLLIGFIEASRNNSKWIRT